MTKLLKIIFKEKLIYVLIFLSIITSYLYSYEYLVLQQTIEHLELKMLFLFLTIIIVRYVIAFFTSRTKLKIKNQIKINQAKDVFDKIINLDYNYYLEIPSGNLINILTTQIYAIAYNGVDFILDLISSLFTLIFLSYTIFSINKYIFFFIFMVIIIFVLLIKYMNKLLTKYYDKEFDNNNKILSIINNCILSFESIKIFNKQQDQKQVYINHLKENNVIKEKINLIEVFIYITSNLSYYSIILIIILLYNKLSISIASVFTIILLVNSIFNPIFSILNSNFTYQNILTAIRKIDEINKLDNEIVNGNKEITHFQTLKIKNLYFKYTDNYILKNLNLTINKGEKIGICGYSGNGKSSLIKLIMRFYDFQKGDILINNISIKDIDIKYLYNVVGLVPQNINLFNGSILDNLNFAKANDINTIIDICKKVNIHDFIDSLPDKYNTIIGERGLKLSNGQQQRLIIARVLLKNPDVIIFDEATASLDNENEKIIQEVINNIQDKTIITIAHRLSTIKNCNRIIVIDDNTIKEIGTYDELMNRKGIFYKLNERN